MNFFEHQDRARRNTSLLVLYFVLALIAIILVVTFAIYFFLLWQTDGGYAIGDWLTSPGFIWCGVATIAVIGIGSLQKLWQLRDGGEALASMLGAREVLPATDEPSERRLRNVVEEMALASGIPAPRTFVLDNETGINAMVAGYRPSEAVVMVTRGTLEQLDRDQLQGVIAHEYSHIFNADMRINLRLMAVLAGILAIGKVGEFLMHANRRRSYSSRNKDQGSIVLLGLALMVIGYVGLFFGRLIKAAVSRQRELLADASAVQFTRNPAGLAEALITIRNGPGSLLDSPHAEDMNHMCFGDTVTFKLQGLLATHPPVDERLAAIGPEWAVKARARARIQAQSNEAGAAETTQSPTGTMAFAGASAQQPGQTGTPNPASRVGVVDAEHISYARTLYNAIPDTLKAQLQQPESAALAVIALMAPGARSDVCATAELQASEAEKVAAFARQIKALGARLRLPLLDLAMPALKQLSMEKRALLRAQASRIASTEAPPKLSHFLVAQLLDEHLGKRSGRATRVRFKRYQQVTADLQLLLSLMVHASGSRDEQAQQLFRQTAGTLIPEGRVLLPTERCSLTALKSSLANLRDLSPLLKAPLVDTLADIILADNQIKVAEVELLRAVCSLIDCPVPPLQIAGPD